MSPLLLATFAAFCLLASAAPRSSSERNYQTNSFYTSASASGSVRGTMSPTQLRQFHADMASMDRFVKSGFGFSDDDDDAYNDEPFGLRHGRLTPF